MMVLCPVLPRRWTEYPFPCFQQSALESHNQSQEAEFSLKEGKQALLNYPFDAKNWQTEALPLQVPTKRVDK